MPLSSTGPLGLLLAFSLLLAAIVIIGPASGWPADHINRLSDIRCRYWCSQRFREGASQVLARSGSAAGGIRRYLVDDYVKQTQDSQKAVLAREMADNAARFQAYYRSVSFSVSSSSGGGANPRPPTGTGGGKADKTVQWFNLYHEYLYCLTDCFEP